MYSRSYQVKYSARLLPHLMVGVAQLVEHPVVVRDVAGSSPVAHPNPWVGHFAKIRNISAFSGEVTQSPYFLFTEICRATYSQR